MRFSYAHADLGFRIACAVLTGMFAANLGWRALTVGTAAFAVLALAYALKKLTLIECILLIVSLLAGIFYFHAYLAWREGGASMPFGKKISFSAVITDEPEPAAHSVILTSDLEKPLKGSVEILAPPGSDFHYGDLLSVNGKIEPADTAGKDPFVLPTEITLMSAHHGFWLREDMINLKGAIIAQFEEWLSEDNAAFLAGVLFGAKVYLTQSLKSALSRTGTTHLVAVSGYKVTLVLLAAGTLLQGWVAKRVAFFGAAGTLILFVLMVGNAASAIRAAIMGFIALGAKEIGEEFSMRNALSFTALIMALGNPTILTQDLSFIISFLSVLGIVYLVPPFQKLFRVADTGILEWKHAAITTLAAQIATIPVLVNAFGQFSLVAIPANILTLSLLPLTMCFGFGVALLGSVSSHAAFGAAHILGFILSYQLAVIQFFAAHAFFLPFNFNSQFLIAAYYAVLAAFAYSYRATDEKV